MTRQSARSQRRFSQTAGVSSPFPAGAGSPAAWARPCGETCSVRRSEPANGPDASRTGSASSPSCAPRPRRRRRSSASSTAPFHATSAPPTRSSGAAYSHRTGSGASARARHDVARARGRRATPPRARRPPRRSSSPIAAAAARRNAHLRRGALDQRRPGRPAAPPRAPGPAARRPSRGRRSAPPRARRDLEADERVGDVHVDAGAGRAPTSARRRERARSRAAVVGTRPSSRERERPVGACDRVTSACSVTRGRARGRA